MNQKTISRDEWNKKVASNRWKNVIKKKLDSINKKDKKSKYKRLKAKLLGFLAGDGGVYIRIDGNNTTHHDILFCPDHESILNSFIEAFEEFYEKKPFIQNMGNYYRVRVTSKPICLDLTKIARFGTLTWRVPFKYLNSDILKIEWLKSFFDSEGSMCRGQIQIQSVNKEGIYEVKDLLEKFNIESKIYKYERKNKNWNTNYILCIMKKDSRKKFLNKIGFNHIPKLKKLKAQFKANVPETG